VSKFGRIPLRSCALNVAQQGIFLPMMTLARKQMADARNKAIPNGKNGLNVQHGKRGGCKRR